MFGLGMQEVIIILVVALLIIGPKKLPDLARSLGKALREFKGAADDFKQNPETGKQSAVAKSAAVRSAAVRSLFGKSSLDKS